MVTDTFSHWLSEARIAEQRLTPEQRGVLQGAYHFRQQQGDDYYSRRLLSHFLLHAGTGLKVAQVARLCQFSRPTASRQQGQSAKEAIQQAQHRMQGRAYGKLLPRYAGPIAGFLLKQPDATRADLITFIDKTFDVHVSRIALYKFLKKYGLDQVAPSAPTPVPATARTAPAAPPPQPERSAAAPAAVPAWEPAPPFCAGGRSMPAPS